MEFDEGVARRLDTVYRTRDMVRRRELVHEALAPANGERILDVGCGPGFYVAELLEVVGPGGKVVGVDNASPMLAIAAHRVKGNDNVELQEAEATDLPFDDASFDAALSVQVLEYVPDVPAALAEMYRVVRPGGRVLVWDVDAATTSMHTTDPARTELMLNAFEKRASHPSLPRTLTAQLRSAGFDDVRMEGHTFATNELVPDTYGGLAVRMITEFVGGREGTSKEEAAAWEAEQKELAGRGEFFFACIQFCFTAKRPG